MAQARRRRAKQGGASGGLPGWAMLTIGLIIGLFVAFLVYLDDLQEPPTAAVEPSQPGADGGRPVAGESGDESASAPDKPKFEFYSILPELEVVVPGDEPEPRAGTGEAAGAAEDPAEDTPASQEPAPAGEGTFYLQAGSFRKAEQADRMKARIALIGLDVAIQTVTINGERWHRVRVGPYQSRDRLRTAQQRLRDNEIDFLVLREKSSG
jgi:cell division septation protein DedD